MNEHSVPPNDGEREYLFVYGTLGRATHPYHIPHHMHGVLTTFATFYGKARTQGKMFYIARYPGVVVSDSSEDVVFGEVYAITSNPQRRDLLWRILDEFEGARGDEEALYLREKARILVLETGEEIEAFMYYYNRPTAEFERIVTGDFSNPLTKSAS
jgi:gamma-glutamylcyclotransferase (GGCT)/AIG2-like uncharacterized protein YtfP